MCDTIQGIQAIVDAAAKLDDERAAGEDFSLSALELKLESFLNPSSDDETFKPVVDVILNASYDETKKISDPKIGM